MRFAMLANLALWAVTAMAQNASPNLLVNSGFELGAPGSTGLKDWDIPILAPGVTYERTTAVTHGGAACARLSVAPEAELNYYQLFQRVPHFRRARPYTLSAWVKSDNVRDGAGAYVSLNFHAAGGTRLDYRDSDVRLTGTTDWTRVVTTATVPDEAAEMRAILVLHGHGTAYFDDVQVEAGDAATPYQPSRVDADAAARDQMAQRAAAEYLRSVGFERRVGTDIAILRDDFPRLGAPSDPAVLAEALKGGGFHTYFVDGEQIANPRIVTPENLDLIVLPYGRAFPAAARETFQDYLAAGGCFLAMGGYAFDDQVVKTPEGWAKVSDLPRPLGEHRETLFDFETCDLAAWSPGAGPGGPGPQLSCDGTDPGQGEQSLRFSVSPMRLWATAVTPPIPPDRFFDGWSELAFRARGDENTPKMIVEWHERDGTRWKTSLDLSTQWRDYVLLPTDFSYWQDSTSVGRGGPGDRPDLGSMDRILIGVSGEIVKDGGDYTFWIDDIRIADDPLAASRIQTECMNTRVCRIQDAMWPTQEQIGVFDPSHPLKDAVTARPLACMGMKTPPTEDLRGPFEGMAAVGVLSTQGHGFGPDSSRIVPIIESFDGHGRPRGALGSLMFQFSGYYRGSAWGFFGVDNQDLFSEDRPGMLSLLPAMARVLIGRLFLFGTEAQYNCYRAGESMRLLTNVANFGREPRQCRVEVRVREQGGRAAIATFDKQLTVQPKTIEAVEFAWKAPERGADFYEISSLLTGPGDFDGETNAVVVWRDQVVARGPRPEIKDTYFEQGGVPRYVIGCQNWWGTNGSISQRRTLDFERDFQMMQDLGLHFSRCFLPFKTEEQKRASDAWVYLAQKHGIIMFHTPNLGGTADAKALAEEIATAKEIAQRYRDVPGFIVDTCNETGIRVDDSEGQRAAFNEYLKRLYGTDEKLRQAWADDPPEKPLGEVPFRYPAQKWPSLRARDVSRFAIDALCRWATDLRDAFRSARPGVAVTPGWGQGFGWGSLLFDPPLATRDQDFTDQHYYGPLDGFSLYIKTLDRRWAGLPWTVGECGARQHPSFPDGETEEQYNRRFLYLEHHAFGMGMAFCASWHWRDPMAGIFPFGKLHADFTLREAALIERNHSLLFTELHPKHEPAEVLLLLPDGNRLGGEHDLVVRGIQTAVDTLLGLHAPFESVCEADLSGLPPTCKTLVWPVPYCPSDETFEAVVRFVQAGGNLLVTGDVGYDGARKWTRTDRVKLLTGVTDVTRRYEGLEFATTQPVQVTCAGPLAGIPPYTGRPALALTAEGAGVVARDAGGGIATLTRLGRGQVLFMAEPIELESGVPTREVYAAFLKLAGAPRLAVTPDRADLHAFRLPTIEGGEILVVHNAGDAVRATVRGGRAELQIDLGQMLPGMCVTDGEGRATQAEGQGEVRLDGKLIMESTGHAAVISLDGRPLDVSNEMLVLPYEAGSVTIARGAASRLAAECGEIREGTWHRLKPPSPVRAADGGIVVECPADTRLEMILVAPADSLGAATRRLARRITGAGR